MGESGNTNVLNVLNMVLQENDLKSRSLNLSFYAFSTYLYTFSQKSYSNALIFLSHLPILTLNFTYLYLIFFFNCSVRLYFTLSFCSYFGTLL